MKIIKKILNRCKREITNLSKKINVYTTDKKNFDKSKLHVKTTGFWEVINQNFFELSFVHALQKVIKSKDSKNQIQHTSYKPDIEFFSVFSKPDKINHSNAKVKIFYTGEDVKYNYSDFSDLLLNKADLSIGFDYPEDINANNYIRYPYWLLCYFGYTEDKDKIKKEVDWFNARTNNPERFCSFIARHDDDGFRKRMIDIVNKVETVSCAGAAYHNDDTLKTQFNDDKIEYLSHFMFNLCPENISVKGYTTEKLFQSYAAGCIPIYSGSEGKPEEFINTKTIVMYNGNNEEEVIEQIKLLRDDEKYYNEFIKQPRLFDNAVDCIYDMNKNLRLKYEDIITTKLLNK